MPARIRPVREGLVIGLIAYGAVALFYAAFDLFAARGPLYTVNLLGRAVFRGLRDPSVLQVPVAFDVGAMFWYNALHLALSLAIGLIVMQLVARGERRPAEAGLMRLLIIAGFVGTILVVGWLSAPIRPVLPWWSIVVANSLAVLLAGGYHLARHPRPVDRPVPAVGH